MINICDDCEQIYLFIFKLFSFLIDDDETEEEDDDEEEENGSNPPTKDTTPPLPAQEDEEMELEKDTLLPPYLPAIQGCRSVEEFQCLNRYGIYV